MEHKAETYEGWTILELMGHRRLGGHVREATIAGHGFLRIDVPGKDGMVATQFIPPSSVYCLTPTTEAMARAGAARNVPEPVARWELPQLPSGAQPEDAEVEDGYESDEEMKP